MNISDYDGFNRLCELSGIIESYHDIRGVHHVADIETKQSLLKAMHITVENDADIHGHLAQIWLSSWQPIIAPVHVVQTSQPDSRIALVLTDAQIAQPLRWQITEDNGQYHSGEWYFNAQEATEECHFDGVRNLRFHVTLPTVFGDGYHQLKLKLSDDTSAESLLIATPDTCYLPENFQANFQENSRENQKSWGISLQLYSLSSMRNWGIGDFTDLNNVCDILAPLGVDVIGLNPLHTLFSHLPENASPYSPSSRKFLNPIYLDVENIDDFGASQNIQQLVNSAPFKNKLESLRDSPLVNYTEVWKTKSNVFELLYQQFKLSLLNTESARVKQFRQFQTDEGKDLFQFSLFEALQADFHYQDAHLETWQQWPDAFHDPESNAVKSWAKSHIERIEFYQYLQWQSALQLSSVQENSTQLGMRIGLYNDLAIGDERYSSTCWAKQSQYALSASIGAPPDELSLLGQNWGLPPQTPQALRADSYGLFIDTLRSNMRHAGALRIDHVMGLMRLYWVPKGSTADRGTYISYPIDDLLGILALESQRNRCLIVGEDLGTVPNEVRHKLWLKRILSYRVLCFEKNWHEGTYKHPDEYPLHALCTAGSHDLPTLKEFWNASDLHRREALNLFPSDDVKNQQWQARHHDRHAIKDALYHQELISHEMLEDNTETELHPELGLAIQRYLARSQSLLMTLQLEDVLSQSNQVNVPGTIDEYPNWRHKISIRLEDWIEKSSLEKTALFIGRERGV